MPFSLMNEHTFEINTTPGILPGNFALIAKGISGAEPKNNEVLAQDKYIDGNGFGETDVIGGQVIISFKGHRFYGDLAQDFIFSKTLTVGTGRRTEFRWTEPNGGKFEGVCTIANVEGPSGEAGTKGEIGFEIHFNGKPTYTAPSADVTPPTVSSVVPANNATAVVVGTTITWNFSEAIDANYVNDANFVVVKQSDSSVVAGTLTLNGSKTQVVFAPSANLSAASVYTAIVNKNIRDAAGNKLAATYSSKFTTA